MKKVFFTALFLCLFFVFFGIQKAYAADICWDGGGTTNNWSEDANWAGNIEPGSGDVAVFDNGTCSGTPNKNATIDAAINVQGINIVSYTGTISQSSTMTITLGSAGYSQSSSTSTFTGNNADIYLTSGGDFTLTSGIFTAPAAIIELIDNFTVTGGTFNHNNSSIYHEAVTDGTATIDGSVTFYNYEIADHSAQATAFTVTTGTTITVTNTFLMTGDNCVCGADDLNGPGTLVAQGNIDSARDGWTGNITITLSGTNNQTITAEAGTADVPIGTFTINKASGTVSLGNNLLLDGSGQDLVISSGTLDMSTFALTVDDVITVNGGLKQGSGNLTASNGNMTIGTTGWWLNNSTGDFVMDGGDTLTNNGYVRLDGTSAACGDADAIALTRSGAGSVNLAGSGRWRVFDANFSDYTASPGITVYSSTNTTGNTGITFTGTCPNERTWDGGGGDNNYNTAGNWTGDTAPSTTELAVFDATSTKSMTVNVDPNDDGFQLNLGFETGTITQTNGVDINLDDKGWEQRSGTFVGGNSTSDLTLNNGGNFLLASGSFTAPGGYIDIYDTWTVSGGSFSHNNGTLAVSNISNADITPGTVTYNDFEVGGNGRTFSITSGTMTLAGDLFVYTTNTFFDGPGGIAVAGNITHDTSNGFFGEMIITVNGTGDQYWSGGTGGSLTGIKVQKSSGTFYIQDNQWISGGGWERVSGNVDATTYTSTVGLGGGNQNVTLTGDTTFYNIETGSNCATITVASGTTVTIANDLAMGGGCGNNINGPGLIEVQGNLSHAGTHGANGDVSITLSGTNNQTITYTGTADWPTGTYTINKPSGSVTLASNIDLSASGQDLIISSGTLNIAGFNLSVNDQFTLGASGTFKLQGGETTVSSLDTITAGSTIEYTGSGTYSSLKMGNSYSNLTVSGSGSFTPASNVTVSGNFTHSAGTFNVAPSGLTVSRNFTRTGGTFTAGTSTVTFDNSGYTSSISGSTTFYNLTSITAGKTLRFASNSTTTVSNALTLRGGGGGLLTLESTDTGYPWHIAANGTATLAKLDVSDSNACSGSTKPLTTTGSADGGNNSCWSITGSYTDWYNDSWRKRRAIIIDHTKVAGDLTDFPFLVSLSSDTGLASNAQDDGDDILFTSEDGATKLAHEIEYFNGTTGELKAWIKVPDLSSTVNTTIYMYYDNSTSTNQQNATSVWDSNYRLVQHLDETSGTSIGDSTSNSNPGSKLSSGNPASTTGQIDGAQDFSSDNITVPDHNSLDLTSAGTVSYWFNADTLQDTLPIYKNNTGTGEAANYFCINYSDASLACGIGNGSTNNFVSETSAYSATEFKYVVLTWNGTTMKLYLNGSEVDSQPQTISATANTSPLYIGQFSDPGVIFFDGKLDEIRLSGTNRSAEWVQTEYNNQSSPTTFFTINQEAVAPITNIRGGVKILPGTRIVGN